jgi:Mrr N-terminal domain
MEFAMSREISVDDEVWSALKALAEPLVDTPNSVLRRLLELEESSESGFLGGTGKTGHKISANTRAKRRRAPAGSLLPENAYERPILKALISAGGRAPAAEIVAAVGSALSDALTPLDKEELPNGGLRWENRAQFTRLKLKERGLIESGSPRGIWEISKDGEEFLREGQGAAQ